MMEKNKKKGRWRILPFRVVQPPFHEGDGVCRTSEKARTNGTAAKASEARAPRQLCNLVKLDALTR